MKIYIDQGQFGEFVSNIIDIENKKIKEASEKENEDKLFNMYIHSMSDKSYIEWKDEVFRHVEENSGHVNENPGQKKTLSMTDDEVDAAINKSRSILKGFVMK